MEFRLGRRLDCTKPVRVYRNLHRNGPQGEPVYSVAQKDGRGHWLVIGYTTHATLAGAHFLVGKGGQAVVRRTGKKVVHAFAVGHLVAWSLAYTNVHGPFRSATYNPYRTDTFVDRETGEALGQVRMIALNETGAWYQPLVPVPVASEFADGEVF